MHRTLATLILALASTGVPQDRAQDEEPRIVPDPALICVDRKVTTGREIGLWRREHIDLEGTVLFEAKGLAEPVTRTG